MCDTIRYLELRAQGLTRTQQFCQAHKRVRQLLEDHAAKPAIDQPCEFSGEPRATFLVDFSPNKRRAASTHGDHTVRVTDVLTGKCTHILTGHPRTPWCVAFNPVSDDILASGCLGGEVRIWDLHGGGSEVLRNPNEGQVITSLAFSPTGDAVVFATLNKVYFWAWTRSKPFAVTQTKYEFERVRWLRFDPFGRYLYTGIANNSSGHRVSAGPRSVYFDRPNETASDRGEMESREQTLNLNRYNEVLRRYIDLRNTREYQGPSSSQYYLDMSTPSSRSSPVNEERLSLAREYARQVSVWTRGQGTAHSGPDVLSHNMGIYSNSQAGRRNTLLAPAIPPRYQGPRPGASSTEGAVPDSSSASRVNTSVSTAGFGRERRGRWGRYRPAFFSLSTDATPQENSDTDLPSERSSSNNDGGGGGDVNFHGSDNIVMNWPNSGAQNSAPFRNFRQRERRLFRDSENRRASELPSYHTRSFRPLSDRHEVSLGDGLDTYEFEIFPVDQEQDTETERASSANRISGHSSSQESSNRTSNVDNVGLRWDELRSLWVRCCNNSSTEGEQGPPLPSSVSRASAMAAGSAGESSWPRQLGAHAISTSGRNDDLHVELQEPLLNSDPFMGHSERNVEFFNLMSNRASSNSTSRSGCNTSTSQSECQPSGLLNLVRERQASQGSSSPVGVDKSNPLSSENSLRDQDTPLGSSVLRRSTGTEESLRLDQEEENTETKPDDQFSRSSGSSDNRDSENVGLLNSEQDPQSLPPPGFGQVLDVFSQNERPEGTDGPDNQPENKKKINEGIDSPSVSTPLKEQTISGPSENLESISNTKPGTLGLSNAAVTRNSDGENQAYNAVSATADNLNHDEQQQLEVPMAKDQALISINSDEKTVTSQAQGEDSEDVSEIPTDPISKTEEERKLSKACKSSSLEEDTPSCMISSSAINSSPKQDNTKEDAANNKAISSFSPSTSSLADCVSTQEQGVSAQTGAHNSQHAVDQITGSGQPGEEMPCSSTPLKATSSHFPDGAACSSLSSKSSVVEPNREADQKGVVSSSDVTAALTQAMAAVRCSQPSVSTSGPSRAGENPFHTLESSALSSAPNSSNAVTLLTTTSVSATPASQSPRHGTLNQLHSPSLTSAFSICSSASSQPYSAINPAAYRTSSSIFNIASTSGSLSNPRTSATSTIFSSSFSSIGNPNLRRSGSQESVTTESGPRGGARMPRLVSFLRPEVDFDERTDSSASLINAGGDDALEQDQQDQSSDDGNMSDLRSPWEQRLHNLSRSFRRRVSELQRRISVLEEFYSNRRTRLSQQDSTARLHSNWRLRRLNNITAASARRRLAMLGSNRARSTESNTSSSTASAMQTLRRAILTNPDTSSSIMRALNHGRASAETSGAPASVDIAARNLSDNDSSAEQLRTRPLTLPGQELSSYVSSPLNRSNNSSSQEGRFRLEISRPPLAPAPGSLHHQVGRNLFHTIARARPQAETESRGSEVESAVDDQPREDVPHAEHLHPDYQHSILGDSLSRPDDHLHYMMNSNIAETFLTRDEHALASNFVPQTHRIQRWSVVTDIVPDISDSSANVVVRYCKLHNDASCCLSNDGKLLAAFVPPLRGFPDKMVLGIFSLESSNFAQCLYTKGFGPNAISVSISPENSYVLVGTAARRLFFMSTNQMVGQVYKMVKQNAGERSMRHTTDMLYYPENRSGHCSVNSARWLPDVGMGLVFGTNRGDLVFSRPGSKTMEKREPSPPLVLRRFARFGDGTRDSPQPILPQFFPRRNRFVNFFSTAGGSNSGGASTSGRYSTSNSSGLGGTSSSSRSSWRSSATQTMTTRDHRSAATQTRDQEAATGTDAERTDQGGQ